MLLVEYEAQSCLKALANVVASRLRLLMMMRRMVLESSTTGIDMALLNAPRRVTRVIGARGRRLNRRA